MEVSMIFWVVACMLPNIQVDVKQFWRSVWAWVWTIWLSNCCFKLPPDAMCISYEDMVDKSKVLYFHHVDIKIKAQWLLWRSDHWVQTLPGARLGLLVAASIRPIEMWGGDRSRLYQSVHTRPSLPGSSPCQWARGPNRSEERQGELSSAPGYTYTEPAKVETNGGWNVIYTWTFGLND